MYYQKRKSKYAAVKTQIETDSGASIKFASKKEAKRYATLKTMLELGEIRNLKLQPHFTLQECYKTPDGETVRAIDYVADFSYQIPMVDASGETFYKLIVEDVKGVKTDVYKLKAKLMQEKFNIKIREV